MHAQGGTFSLFEGDHPALAPIASQRLDWKPFRSSLSDAADNFQPALTPGADPVHVTRESHANDWEGRHGPSASGSSQAIQWEQPSAQTGAVVGGSSGAGDCGPSGSGSAAPSVSWAAIAAEPQVTTPNELPEGFRRASSSAPGYPESLPLPWPNTNLHDPPTHVSDQQVSLYLPSGMVDGPLRTIPPDESNAVPTGGAAAGGSSSAAPVPDFIGTVDNMKNILKMPYSQDAVTMAVYRVGRTIVMDGADMVAEADRLESSPRKPKRRGRRSRAQQEPVVPVAAMNPFSALAQDEEQDQESDKKGADSVAVHALEEADRPLVCDAGPSVNRSISDDEIACSDPPTDGDTSRPSSSESGGSGSSLTSKFVDHAIATQRALDSKSPAMQSTESDSLPHMPKRSRNVHRQLDDLHLLLRADNVLLSGPGHPKVGLRMQDLSEGPMTTDGALDLWMDNMLSDVPESVICWHEKGLLKGYLMMRTEDIPAMSGYAFEPAKVKTDALSVLRWMQQTCTRESSTYVLHRNSNDGELKMFDLQTINQLGGASVNSSSEQQIAASYSVGMMCYRTAGCLSRASRDEIGHPTPELRAKRVRALYKQALELLDGDTYPEERARTHEKLADTFIAPNDLNTDADETDSVYSETHLSEVSLTESEKSDDSADSTRTVPATLVCEQRELRSARARELLEGGSHLTDALETLERQGMADTTSYVRLRHKAISCATAAAATQRKNGEFRAALDTLQNIFSRPDVIGRHSGEFGSLTPHAVPADQGEQLQLVAVVCELLATLADVYMGLNSSSELDSPDTNVADAKPGAFSLPALHVAVMAPFSVLDKRKCLELAMLNFRTAAFGLRTALLQDSGSKPQHNRDGDAASHGRSSDGMPAAVRAKKLLAVLWRKLGDASNELGQLSLTAGDLLSAEECFENALSAFERVEDAENCAIMTLNLAAVLRRKAYAEFVNVKHLTLVQRQLYVKAIALYERALASLGPRRKQQGDRRTKLDQIRSMVQIELAGVYTAFAQQLQAGGRVSLDEGTRATSAHDKDSVGQQESTGQDDSTLPVASAGEGQQGSSPGMYIVDEDVVPDLLRKALEIYNNHNQSSKLCSVHAALGRHYLSSVESAAALGQKRSAVDIKRFRGKAERAMSHLERALSFASSVPGEEDKAASETCQLLVELCRLHRLLPGCGHLIGDAEVSSLRSGLRYLVRAKTILHDVRGVTASKLHELVLQAARDTLREMTRALTSQLTVRGESSNAAQEVARYKALYRQALIGNADGLHNLLQAVAAAEAQG